MQPGSGIALLPYPADSTCTFARKQFPPLHLDPSPTSACLQPPSPLHHSLAERAAAALRQQRGARCGRAKECDLGQAGSSCLFAECAAMEGKLILLPVCQSTPEKQLRWDSHRPTAPVPPATAPPVSAMPSWKLSLRRPSLPTPKSLVCSSQEGTQE